MKNTDKKNPKQAILEKLKKQVSVVETFLNEVKAVDALSDKDLSNRYEVFVADDGSEIIVKDKGLNLPAFTLKNKFVKCGECYTTVSQATFERERYPKTCAAFATL